MAFLQLLTDNAEFNAGLTPICQFTMANDFNRFLDVNNLAFDLEVGATWLLLDALSRVAVNVVPRVADDRVGLTCALAPVQGAAPNAAIEYWAPATPRERELMGGITNDHFRSLIADRPKALFWLLNLTACHQVKPMRAQNISNWFRMTARATLSGRTVLKVIDFSAVTVPNILADDALRDLLDQNQFMTYHTSYSSTGQLVHEMLEVSPTVTNHMFSPATRAAIVASQANPTSRLLNSAISQQAILAAYAYLSSFRKLPDGWFQGEKAKATLPANRYLAYKAIFDKIRDLSTNTQDIADSVDINALVAAIGDNIHDV